MAPGERAAPAPGWVIGDELGRGALGRVVRVRDAADPARALAGKILHRSHRADPRAVARLEAEARMLADVRHPNLVGVHGLVELDGERVLLMDLVDGPDLATVIAREAPLPAARAAAIARGIAAGLAEAHRRGLVHRDLKPANVLVDADGAPRIVDFGLARASALTGVAAGDLVVVGTPAYMAPEAVDPMALDARSDLYALGCILYELLAGRPPFDGATSVAVLEAHRGAPRPELDGAPPPLARLVRWLLAASPADRPQSAAAVEQALAAWEAEAGGGAPAGGALAVRAVGAIAAADRGGGPGAGGGGATCAACGAPALREVPICFRCRAPQTVVVPGDHTVFVIGPGRATHKLDAQLRHRLLDWLRASPALGLRPGRLAQEVPRLPFVLVAGVAADAAGGLVRAVGALGLDAVARRGGRFGLPEIRRKGRTMGGRYAGVGAASVLPGVHALGLLAVPVAGGLAAAALVGGYVGSARPVCAIGGAAPPGLPAPLGEAIARVAPVVAAIEEERHRDALRGVVARVLGLRAALPAEEVARIAADLARVVDGATVAASKLDELERGLDPASLHGGDPAVRARLRERDTWAGRLLELTALLDALRARWAAARAGAAARGAAAAADLEELRAHLDALEELRRL